MPETTSPTVPLGVVLTGGASRRMGTDKCELPWGDHTLREHALHRLAEAGCAPVLCAGGLEADIADAVPGQGPVSALLGIARYAAARWPTQPVEILLLAVDQPLLGIDLLRWLRAGLAGLPNATPPDAACYAGHPLPLALRLSPAVLARLEATLPDLEAGSSCSLKGVLHELNTVTLPVEASDAEQLHNANTPEEWQACLAKLPDPVA